MITLISSIFAFGAGFLFSITCLINCSDEKWRKFRDAVEKAREADKC